MKTNVQLLMLVVGFILVIIPEPATTATGLIMMLASFGLQAVA